MSIMRCDQHGNWDSDFHEECQRCQLQIIAQALTDEENQPHQWMGDKDALLRALNVNPDGRDKERT